jgi:hypothetical protein
VLQVQQSATRPSDVTNIQHILDATSLNLLHFGFLVAFSFNPEDRGDIFLRDVV